MAASNFCRLRLTRDMVKELFRRMQGNRAKQVILARILCAIRFKYFAKAGGLLSVACVNGCGEVETLDHLIKCDGLRIPNAEDDVGKWLTFIKRMVFAVAHKTRNLPTPIARNEEEVEYEISLGEDAQSSGSEDRGETEVSLDRLSSDELQALQ